MKMTTTIKTQWAVWLHGPSGQCKRVSVHDNHLDAVEECERLNAGEREDSRGSSGCYYVVDRA